MRLRDESLRRELPGVKHRPVRTRCATRLLVAMTLVGCGGGDAGQPTPPANGANEPPPKVEPADAPPAVPAESAADAVSTALDGFAEGKPLVLWELLPPGHRDDVTGVVHGFAAKVDRDTWDATVAAVRRTVDVLHERKAWFLSHPLIAARNGDDDAGLSSGGDPLAGVRENWDAAVSLVERVANSKLADHEAVKSLDVGAFLAGTGRDVAETLLTLAGPELGRSIRADVGRLTIETISEDGDRATLRIGGGAFDPVQHEFVRLDGHWLPANVAGGWPSTMQQARDRLAKWNFDDEARRAWHDRLSTWTATIDELERAEDEPAFHARFDAWLASLSPPAAEPPAAEPAPKGTVVVQFDALLDLAEEDRVQVLLNSAAADPDLAVSIPSRQGDATLFEVSHAGTLHGFAERLRKVEGLTVIVLDEATQRVRVRLGG
jgi:hypothetical protein